MNIPYRPKAMEKLGQAFDTMKIVSREQAETITGLSERSISRAYHLETNDCLVKIDPAEMPSIVTGITHVSYMRVKDLNRKQAIAYRKYFRQHREGTVQWDDVFLEQIEKRLDTLYEDEK